QSLLAGPLARELEGLRERVDSLEDVEELTARMADVLPRALAVRPSTEREMAAALSPLVKAVVWEMRQREAAAGGTLRETISLGLRQVGSRVSGMAGAVLGRFAGGPEIMRLRLIHRSRQVTVEEFIGTFEEVEA